MSEFEPRRVENPFHTESVSIESRRRASALQLKLAAGITLASVTVGSMWAHHALDDNGISQSRAYEALDIDKNEFNALKKGRNSLLEAQKDLTAERFDEVGKELTESQEEFIEAGRLDLETAARTINDSYTLGGTSEETMLAIESLKNDVAGEIDEKTKRVAALTRPQRSRGATVSYVGSLISSALSASALTYLGTKLIMDRRYRLDIQDAIANERARKNNPLS